MNSGSAASSQEAPLPQILVASTVPAGMPPAANCMPSQPQASRLMAIHTPAPEQDDQQHRNQDARCSSRSMAPSDAAGGGALDHLLGGLRRAFS